MSVRLTPGATVIGIGGLDSGAIVSVDAPGSSVCILPWVAKLPPSGMTFVIVGLGCAATEAGSMRGARAAAHASAMVAGTAKACRCIGMISSPECKVCSSIFRFRPLHLTFPLAERPYESAISHCREGSSIRRRNAAHYADLVDFVPWGHAGSHL